MNRSFKHIILAVLALTVSFLNVNNAYARNAGVVRTVYRSLEGNYADLQAIKKQLDAFQPKDSYCRKPHPDNKDAALAELSAIENALTTKTSQFRSYRASMNNLIRVDGLGGALDALESGASDKVLDKTYFKRWENIIEAMEDALGSKRAAVKRAETKDCGRSTPSAPAVGTGTTPAISIPDPLTGIDTDQTFADVTYPTSFPEKFCHQDEKDQLLRALRNARFDAYKNSVKAGNLAVNLEHKLGDLITARDRAFRAADAAAKSGDTQTMNAKNTEYQSLKAQVDAAQAKFPGLIAKAKADQKRWRDVVDAIDAEIAKVNGIPVVDCTPADLTPANTLGQTQFPGTPESVASLNLKPVDIPSVPEKVCTEEAKREIENKAYTAMSNSWDNRDQWKKRLVDLNNAIDKAEGDAAATLIQARAEARTESAKWVRIVQNATAAYDKAQTIKVDDCNGLTEPGKTATAFPGVHMGVPEAATRAYDLPNVPDYVCSWEEKQALIKRAQKAREAASHNHRQWGARATALGKLLYGDNAVGGDRTDLLSAHAEARAQADYWAEQMLNIAHGVYWKLQDVEIRDCSKPEKKVSMGALNNAINNRPVFNGGQGGGARLDPFGSTCSADITCRGSAFGLGQIYRTPTGHGGFDGSEAERALEHTLGGVEQRHQHGPDCDHNAHGGNAQKNDRNAHTSPNPARNGGHHYPQSETSKTGAHAGDYVADERDLPNVTSGEPAAKDGLSFPSARNSSNRTGLELETPEIEYRNGMENSTVRKMPGLPKHTDIVLKRPTPEQYETMGSLPVEGPRYETNAGDAHSTQKAKPTYQGQNSGEWVQVAPPVLVIQAGAADHPTGNAQQKTTGGN